VDLVAGRAATLDVTFAPPAVALERVTVTGRGTRGADRSGFKRRANGGFGRFITSEQIERTPTATVTDLLRTVAGLRIVPAGDGVHQVIYSRGQLNLTQQCKPAVYVDGTLAAGAADALDSYVHVREVAAVEVYTDFATAPLGFQRGACGSILVWTKGAI
jgi:outer membrane cobalamin receptor